MALIFFFVISGYLITRIIFDEIIATRNFNFVNFYSRRVRRLFPALFFVLVVSFILAFLMFTPSHFQRFGGELLYSAVSMSNFYFWNESGYFNTASEFKPLLHTWSLSVEEQFYLIWPVMTVLILRKAGITFLGIFIALVFFISLYGNNMMADGHSNLLLRLSPLIASWFKDGLSTIFYLTPFRMFEFAIGASLIFVEKYKRMNNCLNEILMIFGLLMIGFSVHSFTERTLFPSYNALIPCFGAALIIFSCSANLTGYLLSNKLAVYIGRISYSIYLIHWPLIVFYKYWKITPLTGMDKIAILILSIALGFLMFTFIENPFRIKSQEKIYLSNAGFGLVCSFLLLFVAVPAGTIWANAGWPWRVGELPKTIASQLKNSTQFHKDQFGGAGFSEPYSWIGESANHKADIVIIGDSHAQQLKTGIKELVSVPYRKSVYFSTSSCLILPDMTRTTPGFNWDDRCRDVLNNAMEVIANSPNAVVVLAELWVGQVPIAAYLSRKEPLLVDHNLKKAYTRLIPALDALKNNIGNRKLVIVGNVPGAGSSDIMGCFLRPRFLRADCNKIVTSPRSRNPDVDRANNPRINGAGR